MVKFHDLRNHLMQDVNGRHNCSITGNIAMQSFIVLSNHANPFRNINIYFCDSNAKLNEELPVDRLINIWFSF